MKFPRAQRPLLSALAALVTLITACSRGGQEARALADNLYAYDPAKAVHSQFSGAAAYDHVKALVELGPRPPGSEALERSRVLISKELEKHGWKIEREAFSQHTPRGEVQFCNLRARFPVHGSDTWARTAAVLFGSHIDTKVFSGINFVGANDSGSSTGALMEMARVLAARPELAQFIELVFFDGEEAFVSYSSDTGGLPEDGLYGSRHRASELRKLPEAEKPLALILLDMVGDKNLNVKIPENSTARLRDMLFESAQELGYDRFFANGSGGVTDDHVPFLFSGIEALDIIDLDYPAWHTSADKMDQISPQSLEICGRTALLLVEKHLLGKPK